MPSVKATATGLEYCQSMTTAKAEHDAKQTPFRPITDQLKTQLPEVMKLCKCGDQLRTDPRTGRTTNCMSCSAKATMARRGEGLVQVCKMEVYCLTQSVKRKVNNYEGRAKHRLKEAVDLIAKMKAGT